MTGQLTAQIRTSDSSNSQSCGLGPSVWGGAAAGGSEFFTGWPQVELLGPGRAMLEMELVVGFRDCDGLEQSLGRIALGDHAIEDDMGNVNAFRPELTRHGLREGAQRKFRRGEGGKSRAAPDRSGRTGEDDRPASLSPVKHGR